MWDILNKRVDEAWYLIKMKKKLKNGFMVKLSKISVFFGAVSASTFYFYNHELYQIIALTFSVVVISAFITTVISIVCPPVFNYKISKKMIKKEWDTLFENKVYNNKELAKMYNALEFASPYIKEHFYLILGCGFENKADLMETMAVHNYYDNEDQGFDNFKKYINNVNIKFNKNEASEICTALLNNKIEEVSEEDFFTQRKEIISLIKENIISREAKEKLANSMESRLDYFNEDKKLEEKFNKIATKDSVNFKKKKSENFVMKAI